MKLYMHPVSMTSRPIRLFIAENGIAVDEQMVDLMAGEHYGEAFTAINPSRRSRSSRTATSASPRARRS